MSDYTCEKCNSHVMIGDNIQGCEHYPKDDLIEYSGKLMGDGMDRVKADWQAIKAQQKLLNKGEQTALW